MLALYVKQTVCVRVWTGRLTFRAIEHDQDVVVLARILDLIQADKAPLDANPPCQPPLGLLHLAFSAALVDWEGKFGVDELDAEFAAAVFLLEGVHAGKPEVHGVGVGEVFEEGQQLNHVVLVDNLQADRVGGPLLVDGDDHAAARDGEGACNAGEVSMWFGIIDMVGGGELTRRT